MKTLLLMRHAKSSWKHLDRADHDRALNSRGKRDAPRMGTWLRDHDLIPDVVVASTARRARSTARRVARAAGVQDDVILEDALYHASSDEIMEIVARADDSIDTLLVVGHNPGMAALASIIANTYEPFPTAAILVATTNSDSWRDAEAGGFDFVALWRPREIALPD